VNTEKPKTVRNPAHEARQGEQWVTLGFLNNYNDDRNPDPKMRGDRNLFVDSVEIEGTL
jgi:hypothetical protein